MFKEYSSHDLMSKAQCQKYQQRCLVDMMQMSESKVDKIFEDYDKDKDGYLTQEDFFKYYLHTAKNKEMHIWTHLENFGMRADLEILYDKEYEHPNGDTLTRHLLLRNNKFMLILLGLLQVDDESLAASAWSIISRLPLAADDQFFTAGLKLDLTRKYMFRYWLYMVGHRGHYELVTESVLRQIMESDI